MMLHSISGPQTPHQQGCLATVKAPRLRGLQVDGSKGCLPVAEWHADS